MDGSRGPYGRLARAVLSHRAPVAIALAILIVISLLLSSRLAVESNLLSLLPDDEPAVQALRALNEEEGGVGLLTLAFEAKDPATLDPFLDDLVVRLEALDDVRFAIHEVDPDLAFQIGLLQLPPEDTADLATRLKGALLMGPGLNPFVMQRLMNVVPISDRMKQTKTVDFLGDPAAGKGKVLVRPVGPSTDQEFCERLMAQVDVVLREANAEAHGIELRWMGGAYRHVVEDRAGIRRDITRTGIASAILVLIVMAAAFRSIRATVMVYLPLIASNAVALATLSVLFGSINTFTSFSVAILLGLGTDFALHLIGRYREERARGVGLEDAVANAWDRAGPPCMTAALTGAAGFLALATARFQGFSQLGVALALGLMICLGMVLVSLPLLIPLLDPRPPVPHLTPRGKRESRSTYRWSPVGLMFAVLATGVAATRIDDLTWEFDISTLRTDGLAYAELSEEERVFARESFSPVVVSYPNMEQLRADQLIVEAAMTNGRLPHIGRALSLDNVLPPDQDQRVAHLRMIKSLRDDPNYPYLPQTIRESVDKLSNWHGNVLTAAELPESLQVLLGADGTHHRLLLFPKGNMWDLREASKLLDEVDTALPGRDMAGEFLALGSLYDVVKRDMPMMTLLSLLMCTVLAALDLRRMAWVAVAIGTLLGGVFWTAVAVGAVGVKLSIVNIVGLPILFGISIDVCVHLMHRLEEEGPGGVRRALRTTGMASLISTLTSILSFGTLLLASNRGVRSLGLLVAIGLTIEFLVTAILMTLAWSAGWRISGRAPGGNPPHFSIREHEQASKSREP